MKIEQTNIKDLLILSPKVFDRGFFESYNKKTLERND
jgi:dTDP-4-dehydrorhamnose 3,5-epimerase-like enzyme